MVGSFLTARGDAMEDSILTHLLQEYLNIIILGAGALAAIIGIWRRYLKRGVCRFCEAIQNFYKAPSRVLKVYTEIITNDGSSIKDQINYLERTQKELIKNQLIGAEKARIILEDHPVALIETDANGNVIWANNTYLQLVERDLKEVLNNGWVNVIDQEERSKVFDAWVEAVRQERPFEQEIHITTPNGRRIKALGCAFPIQVRETTHGYIGKVKILVEEICKDV